MTYVNALTLFREGRDTAEIAAILGCSEATAYNNLHRLREGMAPASLPDALGRPQWHDLAIKLRDKGVTCQKIADQFGVTPQRVHQVTRREASK